MEQMGMQEETNKDFRRDAIKFILWMFLIYILCGIWFVGQSTHTLYKIEEKNRMLIEEITRLLKDNNLMGREFQSV